jgi:hypothetical protein
MLLDLGRARRKRFHGRPRHGSQLAAVLVVAGGDDLDAIARRHDHDLADWSLAVKIRQQGGHLSGPDGKALAYLDGRRSV